MAKHKGSTVYAATANQGGALICRATRIGPDSTAAQLVHTVQTTAAAKVSLSSLADKVRSVFVPAVIGISCVVLIIWLLLGQSFAFALARAISVLAVSSPCVLALAASAAIMSGASVGAKHGIVFKTAASLQSIGTLHTAVLDKAGTITNGEPEVVTIVGTRSVPAKFLLGMAAGLESQSQDPLARAVMRKAAAENIKLSAVKDVTILDGQGLTGKMAGKVMAGGSAEFIAAQCELALHQSQTSYTASLRILKKPLQYRPSYGFHNRPVFFQSGIQSSRSHLMVYDPIAALCKRIHPGFQYGHPHALLRYPLQS